MKIIQVKRKQIGLTQQELANRLSEKGFKVDRSTVAKWETGGVLPRADKLPELAEIFGCTVDELLKDEEPSNVQAS